MDITIRKIEKEELANALSLVWRVFQEYEASDYTQDGVDEFYRSIHDDRFISALSVVGAFSDDVLVGVIATRNKGSHIALLFVDGKYHTVGIGSRLIQKVLGNRTVSEFTVNSSPCAIGFYHRLGFCDTDTEQTVNGLRFTPMVYENKLLKNLDKLHTTQLGAERIRKNLSLDSDDIVEWCRHQIALPQAVIKRQGKNWYVQAGGYNITVNVHTYTIITAHKV